MSKPRRAAAFRWRAVLDAQSATTLFGALRNTAGVTRSQLSGSTYDNISIRGILVENRGNYRLNGSLPIVNLIDVPLENKDRVEVLKGASTLYYGFVPPSGIVNFVTRRAGEKPVNAVNLWTNDHGGAGVHADMARRFGAERQFGARVNLASAREDIGIERYDGERELQSAALDWRASERVSFKLDLERYRKDVSEREGFFNWLFEWHSALLAEGAGKRILLAAALAGMGLSIAGIVLWWPSGTARWRDALRLRLRANPTRAVLDLHRAGGALVAALLLAAIASGMYMAWRPISAGLDSLAGFRAPSLPALLPTPGVGAAPPSRLMEAANLALPGGRLSIVTLGAGADRPVRVRKQLPDEVHPNGLSSVWLHPQTAAVLAVTHWRDGGPGLLGFEYLYPLHTGVLGGAVHRTATSLAGFALFLLGASGAWLWWKRGRPLA